MHRKEILVAASTGILLLTSICYWPGLYGPLVLDDPLQLGALFENERTRENPWPAYLFNDSGPLGRPLAMLTFIINIILSGDSVFWLKFVNLGLHLITGVLVYLLTYNLLGRADAFRCRTAYETHWWALAIAALWLLHPLHASTVLYTVQRMAVLSALFVFLGMWLYARGRGNQLAGKGGGYSVISSFIICLPLAALSKENGLLLPLFLLLTEQFFYNFDGDRKQKKLLATCYLFFFIIPFISGVLYLTINYERYFVAGYEIRPYTLVERVMTETRVLVLYISQLLFPLNERLTFFYDNYVISRGLLSPPATLTSLSILVLLSITAWFFRNKYRIISFGIVFFLSAHLLESTIFPLLLVFEHRNYVASYGVILGIVAVFMELSQKKTYSVALMVPLIACLALMTSARAEIWSSENSLYNFIYRNNPGSGLISALAADSLSRKGRFDEAINVLNKVDSNGARIQALYIRCLSGQALDSDQFRSAINRLAGPLDTYATTAVIELSNLGLDNKCRMDNRGMMALLDNALSRALVGRGTTRQKLLMYKAHFLIQNEELDYALEVLDSAFVAQPESPLPLFLAAKWLLEKGDYGRAERYYRQAVKTAKSSEYGYTAQMLEIGNQLKAGRTEIRDE